MNLLLSENIGWKGVQTQNLKVYVSTNLKVAAPNPSNNGCKTFWNHNKFKEGKIQLLTPNPTPHPPKKNPLNSSELYKISDIRYPIFRQKAKRAEGVEGKFCTELPDKKAREIPTEMHNPNAKEIKYATIQIFKLF